MTSFFETEHCKSAAHCQLCRDPHNPNFRVMMDKLYQIGKQDFACPESKPWGFKEDSTPKSKGLGDTIQKVLSYTGIDKATKWLVSAVTGKTTAEVTVDDDCGCSRRRELLNEMVPYRTDD